MSHVTRIRLRESPTFPLTYAENFRRGVIMSVLFCRQCTYLCTSMYMHVHVHVENQSAQLMQQINHSV